MVVVRNDAVRRFERRREPFPPHPLHFPYHFNTDSGSGPPYRAHSRKENLCPVFGVYVRGTHPRVPDPLMKVEGADEDALRLRSGQVCRLQTRELYQNEGTNPFDEIVRTISKLTEQTQFEQGRMKTDGSSNSLRIQGDLSSLFTVEHS